MFLLYFYVPRISFPIFYLTFFSISCITYVLILHSTVYTLSHIDRSMSVVNVGSARCDIKVHWASIDPALVGIFPSDFT